jgi:hypothetical protein
MPTELRQAAIAINWQYPGALVRYVLSLAPWQLNKAVRL